MGLAIGYEYASEYEQRLLEHADDPAGVVRVSVAEALYSYGNKDKGLKILKEELDTTPDFAKLRALNTLQALKPQIQSAAFHVKLKELISDYDTGSAPKKYIHRAAEYLLKIIDN